MQNNVRWAISTSFIKPGFPNIRTALAKSNTTFWESEHDSTRRSYTICPYAPEDGPVVLYGPIQFIKAHARAKKAFIPGAYGFTSATNVSSYRSHIDNSLFANDQFVMLPWGTLSAKKEMLADLFGDKLFIRPDSGMKSFTGFTTDIGNLEYELNSLSVLVNPDPTEMCVISPFQTIHGEYRFVICDRKVVTGSQYTWEGVGDARIDVHPDALLLANDVASLDYQIDVCYTVDIFLTDRGAKIGEFNSFASAGLYHCNVDLIVSAINAAATKEWNDE